MSEIPEWLSITTSKCLRVATTRNFNKGLHDKSWPFKAGGKGVKGASGT